MSLADWVRQKDLVSMMSKIARWRLWAICGIVLILATGCFQDVGDSGEPNTVSQFLPTETPTEAPTETPTVTVEPTQDVASLSTETPTDLPTETPTVTVTPTPTTAEVGILDQPVSDLQGTQVAQLDGGEVDEFELTATQFVLQVTQTAEFGITETARALGIGSSPTPTIDPLFFVTPTPRFGFATATPGFSQPGSVCIHEVKAGETLFRLSITYGVQVMDLAAASGISNPQLILIGDKINIPNCGTTGVFPPPTSQPTQAFAQADFGTGGNTLAGTPGVVQPTGASRTHVVQQGETLYEISLLYGVPVNSIAAANGITNINFILMTTQLIIPAQ
jgi:LysM repeat protein